MSIIMVLSIGIDGRMATDIPKSQEEVMQVTKNGRRVIAMVGSWCAGFVFMCIGVFFGQIGNEIDIFLFPAFIFGFLTVIALGFAVVVTAGVVADWVDLI